MVDSKNKSEMIGDNSVPPGKENQTDPKTPKIIGTTKKFINLFLLILINR